MDSPYQPPPDYIAWDSPDPHRRGAHDGTRKEHAKEHAKERAKERPKEQAKDRAKVSGPQHVPEEADGAHEFEFGGFRRHLGCK